MTRMSHAEIPKRLPTATLDRCVDALTCAGEMVIQAELRFEHSLDEDRLRRALRLVLDAEPVLGCRFLRNQWTSWWERVDPDPRRLLTVTDDENGFERFYHLPFEADEGTRIRAFLLSPPGNRLLIQLDHRAADAGGTKDAVYRAGEIYTELGRDPSFLPRPNLEGARGFHQALREIPIRRYPRFVFEALRMHKDTFFPRRSHRMLLEEGSIAEPVLLIRHLNGEAVRTLAENGRKCGATLNDLFLAAFLRANVRMGRWNGRDQLRYVSTVDLRNWYLSSGRAEAVCNLSCMEFLNLGTHIDNTIHETVSRVAERTGPRKAAGVGLSGLLLAVPLFGLMPAPCLRGFFRWASKWGVSTGNLANTFTNMGPIREEGVCFDRPAKRAWLVTPAGYPPLFVFGLTGYRDTLTLSARTFSPGGQRKTLEDLLDTALDELPW